jgi:hypothetical protein
MEAEKWELDFEWLRVRHFIKEKFKKSELPDLNTTLMLIGIQELGMLKPDGFTKEEKQDLMHIATCELLSIHGYYSFIGKDQDGWPHYEMIKPFTTKGVKDQEILLKELITTYFKNNFPSEFK